MTRDAEMSRSRLRRPRAGLAARRDQLDDAQDDPRPAAVDPAALRRAAAPRRHPRGRRRPRSASWPARAEPGSDAQLQLLTPYAALQRGGDDAAWLRGLLDGTQELDGLAVDTEMRWTLLTSLASVGAVDEDRVGAELRARQHHHRPRARRARPRRPADRRGQGRRRGATASRSPDPPNAVVEAIGLGFTTVADPEVLRPFVATYHDALLDVWTTRTQAVAEAIVLHYYPAALADQALLDATQAWLDAHAGAPAGLRRLVAENRDGVARALRAQSRDADA